MEIFGFQEILSILLIITPGYITVYLITIFTDYTFEKDQLERIIQYLIFSSISYLIAILFLLSSNYFLILVGKIDVIFLDYFFKNSLILTFVAVVVSVPLGILSGKYCFGNGYPHKYFDSKRNNSPSIYSNLFTQKYQEGASLAFHLKNGNIIRGKFSSWDFDEEKRNYVFSIVEAEEFFEQGTKSRILSSERTVINVKDCFFIEVSS